MSVKNFEFYKQFINHGDLVFDVGANIGNRTKIFLSLNAKVIAFEPQIACYDYLKLIFKNNDNCTIIDAALGEKEGESQMFICNTHVLSTLSQDWIRLTKESGRFRRYEWYKKQNVRITTLDKSIEKFGVPFFIKIDVEGYEFAVLSGLTRPIKFITIEFASENLEDTYKCIDYLNSMSKVLFQFSIGESMEFFLSEWVSRTEIKRIISEFCLKNKFAWGDIYIKNIEVDN